MRRIYNLAILIILFVTISTIIPTYYASVTPISSIQFQLPVVEITSAISYDHGLVLTLEYVNLSSLQKAQSELIVYFINSSMKYQMYSSTVSSVSGIISTILNGHLIVIVESSSNGRPQSIIYNFSGLQFQNYYTLNGLILTNEPPSYNLTYLSLIQYSSNFTHANYTILLPNEKIVFKDELPLFALQLPEGILVLSYNVSDTFISQNLIIPYNLTLLSLSGKVLWSKIYNLSYYNPEILFGNISFSSTLTNYAIIGNTLYLINYTIIKSDNSYTIVNESLLGVSLNNGNIIYNFRIYPNTVGLANVQNNLYGIVLQHEGTTINTPVKYIIIQKYSDGKIYTIAKIPFKERTVLKTITTPDGKTISFNYTQPLTNVFISNNFILVSNPEEASIGSNITVIYNEVYSYTLGLEVTQSLISNSMILLGNRSSDYYILFLNTNGSLKFYYNLGEISNVNLLNIISLVGVKVAEVSPMCYYVAYTSTYTNPSSLMPNIQINVYLITFNSSSTIHISTTSNNTTTQTHNNLSASLFIILIVIVIIVIGILIYINRKSF
ncbi:hypothetical protein [Sulfurisphaera ohwakuensis]|uniref:Uncharacterized protein n=1 Tax=Sulfurisphaera ohwakuensis TaxID=69656 RepID=A0A650CDR3_SULOH|nr:hypothetical protein [Sulfurisphaera ohwakuensis]MBB5253099.1 hypothetical protein [Sulfurisphaera ohwakuensis]QGR15981.1 hypothetical protein D1869_01380 [Sulfurisphaera ohwakuensis]